MSSDAWVWVAIGAAGVMVLIPRPELSAPVESDQLRITPHGYFGASRKGPPRHEHQGLDLIAKPGSHVIAIGDGEVIATQPGLGKIVRKLKLTRPAAYRRGARKITHVVYADLGKPLVQPGDSVRRGDAIAVVAAAGFVHFAVKELRDGREHFFNPNDAGFELSPAKQKGTS